MGGKLKIDESRRRDRNGFDVRNVRFEMSLDVFSKLKGILMFFVGQDESQVGGEVAETGIFRG